MSGPFAVAVPGGGGVIDDAQQHQDNEYCVHKGQQAVPKLAEIHSIAKDGRASLDNQQNRRYQREPELLARNTYFPVDVAKILSIGRNTAYELVRSGKIRSVKIGRTYRIPLTAVEDYLNASDETGIM